VTTSRALARIKHALTRGQLREVVIRDLLRPFLPMDVGLGTGEIVTAGNQTSRQQDIVMFDRRVLPPITLQGDMGIFPIESVAYSIEVKSDLTEAELRSAHKNAEDLAQFNYITGEDNEGRAALGRPRRPLVAAIFALGSSLSPRQTIIERYKRISRNQPRITVICVVGSGYWWYQPPHWHTLEGGQPFDEVLGFLGGTANSFGEILRSRGTPKLGHYFLNGKMVDA
jgi:hypothetical protein